MPETLHSLDNLRCFVDAARMLSFTKAARRHAITPAAFGQRIKQLEEQLGAPLFVRSTRQVRLAAAGMRLLPAAERCIAAADECRMAVHGQATPSSVQLLLGTRHELGLSWIVPAFDELEQSWPGLSLHLYVGSGPDLLARLRTFELDCAITSSRFNDAALDAIPLHREGYVLCAAPSLLKHTPFRRMADALRHHLFDISDELPLFRYFRDATKSPELRFAKITRLGSIDAIRAFVLQGKGVAVLPEYLVNDDLRTRALVRVLRSVEAQHDYFRLVFRSDDPRRPVFVALSKKLLQMPLA